jgi:hypothetical protein
MKSNYLTSPPHRRAIGDYAESLKDLVSNNKNFTYGNTAQ